jgi:hypothetical protein
VPEINGWRRFLAWDTNAKSSDGTMKKRGVAAVFFDSERPFGYSAFERSGRRFA